MGSVDQHAKRKSMASKFWSPVSYITYATAGIHAKGGSLSSCGSTTDSFAIDTP